MLVPMNQKLMLVIIIYYKWWYNGAQVSIKHHCIIIGSSWRRVFLTVCELAACPAANAGKVWAGQITLKSWSHILRQISIIYMKWAGNMISVKEYFSEFITLILLNNLRCFLTEGMQYCHTFSFYCHKEPISILMWLECA